MLLALGLTYFFITAQVYAWHPTEFHFYANDEMVATTEAIMKTEDQQNYNICLSNCEIYFQPEETNYLNTPIMKCFDSCNNYYSINNHTIRCKQLNKSFLEL